MERGDDAALVRAALAGSDQAFGLLVHRHQQALRAFLRRACGADAEDVAQEAFVTAWTALRRLKEPAGFRSWLFGIAWKKVLTRMRSTRRGEARDGAWLQTRPQSVSESHADRMALERALAALSPDQRAVAALCLAQDWSHSEAAEALSLPLGSVKSHLARARARLLEVLGESDGR
ncbi:RNA polymerase sigma factor [Brevundimonas sp.]|uniref:RNA polymerase sigma factor n=1 Tax=Brevundimonas sp. TaxID=1871086 RepID=UPI0025EE2454|nr:RNA polymerase sigma factor [Brevundimonas sp.]